MPETPTFLGVVEDPRSEIEKAQDYPDAEVRPATAAPIVWRDKPRNEWRRFKERDQNGSGMCMAQSGVKMLGIENVVEEGKFVELSALPVYQKRLNQTTAGMWLQDLLDILSKPNACLEEQVPSQKLTEFQANNPRVTLTREQRAIAEFYRANGYFFLPAKDIDRMAEIIDQGKAVELIIFFLGEEYWKPVPNIIDPSLGQHEDRTLRHGIAAVDYTMYEGEKALVIEDSAGTWTGFDGKGQRIIKESWLKKRCYGAGYLVFRKNSGEQLPPRPHVKFDKTMRLRYGMMNNFDVADVQQILQFEGFLATHIDNKPLPLGNMLQMTCTALKKWQVAHGIMDFANEPDVRKVVFGPKSIGLANTLYE